MIEQVPDSARPVLAGNRRRTIIPLMLLETVPAGRYAVRPDDVTPYTFMRVSRPTRGKLRGCLNIQTQHGESWASAFVVRPDESMYWFNLTVENDLLQIVLNPERYAREYGKVIGRCCSCGKVLTDERSRYYAIGPECEKSHPELIEWVDEQEGPYGS